MYYYWMYDQYFNYFSLGEVRLGCAILNRLNLLDEEQSSVLMERHRLVFRSDTGVLDSELRLVTGWDAAPLTSQQKESSRSSCRV